MRKADSGAIWTADLPFIPTFNTVAMRVRIILRISGSVVVKTVINAVCVGGSSRNEEISMRPKHARTIMKKKNPLKADDLQQQDCILIKDMSSTKNKGIS